MTDVPTTRTLGKDDWMTPPEVFDPVCEALQLDFDASAGSPEESRLPMFIDPDTDALDCSWKHFGQRAWLNPPYGRDLRKWFDKVIEQAPDLSLVCMLTYANTETRYWLTALESGHLAAVLFLTPRVKFISPTDPKSTIAGAPKGSALLFFTPDGPGGPVPHRYWDYREDDFFDVLSGLPLFCFNTLLPPTQ